jgi:putative ATP-binding cassette transporter
MRGLGSFLVDAWRLVRPYFNSEEKWSARGLLLAIVLMRLSLVGMNVVLSYWGREFFNSLQQKDWDAFIGLLFTYRQTDSGWMPGFSEVAVIYILIAIYVTYLTQWLQIRWRRWLTGRFLDEWLADRAYYRIGLTADRAGIGTDNPDQRIAEDLRDLSDGALTYGLSLMSNVVTLFSFVGILWGLSGSFTLLGFDIPGYMVWVALIYAVIGTWLTHLVGRPLFQLNFRQQRVEADFRYALVRLRENVEGVALYGGETEEKQHLITRFAQVVGNWRSIMTWTKRLNALTTGYDQVASVFPYLVAAPRYFFGTMPLGGLTQTAGAFGHVQGALSWFVSFYSALAGWRATVERLATFWRTIQKARDGARQGLRLTNAPDGAVALHDVTLALPDGTRLLENADLTLTPGVAVLITGRSGSGKSTLFRAIAGIWPFGSGQVARPSGTCLFLPQRPYLPLGTLSHAIAYPAGPDAYPRADIVTALEAAGLAHLVARLDADENWAQSLSGGEQQRVALARALLAKPDWLFLDEATASLDPDAETALYDTLRRLLPATTIVSISHNPAVARFHARTLVFRREDAMPGALVAAPEAVAE